MCSMTPGQFLRKAVREQGQYVQLGHASAVVTMQTKLNLLLG